MLEHSNLATDAGTSTTSRAITGNCPAVRRLVLSNFRNYDSLRLSLDETPVVLTGPNGSGKTNILEALSFLSPGRGLRRARLSDIDRIDGDAVSAWAMSAEIQRADRTVLIGTGRDPDATGSGRERRVVRIDGTPARSQNALTEQVTVSWLTPQMDRLFIDGPGGRRRFLDRLVHAFDPQHATRVIRYTHVQRQRMQLRRDGRTDNHWYSALEQQLVETGVAIAAARCALIDELAPLAATACGSFPGAILSIDGRLESWLQDSPALKVEDRMRLALQAERRDSDADADPGPHRSDLRVLHATTGLPAGHCSTGEQKALLIAILLAHARLRRTAFGDAPLMLLDDVAAHLDADRRCALSEHLAGLQSQAWMTGTDASQFEAFCSSARFLAVSNSNVTSRS